MVASLGNLLPLSARPSCVFASRPIGAGAPDLTVIYREPRVTVPIDAPPDISDVLAYLRVVNKAREETLRSRLRLRPDVLESCVAALLRAKALRIAGEALVLNHTYRDPLREIVAIEAKISKWRDAVSQAARNRVFAHRSFVALPEAQAQLAIGDERVAMLGIGVIAVSGTTVRVVRRSRRSQPRVWRYYFDLLFASERHKEEINAVHRSNRSSEAVLSAF